MDRPEVVESARKRQKTEDGPAVDSSKSDAGAVARIPNPKELEVGIAELVTANIEGIGGILKKR